MGESVKRLEELKKAAESYFDKEKTRITAQYDFLEAIGKKRNGSKGLAALNTEGASKILSGSITDYLGEPV